MEEVVHFALSNYTACYKHIVGSTVFCDDGQPDRVSAGQGTNIQHTCLADSVTCEECKKSATFKDYLKTLYD